MPVQGQGGSKHLAEAQGHCGTQGQVCLAAVFVRASHSKREDTMR